MVETIFNNDAINTIYDEEFIKKRAEEVEAAEQFSCEQNPQLTELDKAEFATSMLGPDGVDELSAILMERIVEEQDRLKAQVPKSGAAGNGSAGYKGGSRKRKRSKKRKGKGNKTRKNAQNNNNNTTRRRKKTARRRRTKRA